MKPLAPSQIAFKMDEITYVDRKTIFLDRMLLVLFERLRFEGRQAVHRGKRSFDPAGLAARIASDPVRFPGFEGREDLAEAWLRADVLEIMNRGKPGEILVGPRPFHLNAFKATNTKAVQDWGASAQVWAMLYHADREVLGELRTFFGEGLDFATDRYDGTTDLDIEAKAVLGIVDGIDVMEAPAPAPSPIAPLCLAQGHRLAEDLRAILAYRTAVPRLVLAGYVRTLLGLHLSLYQLRLFRLVPALVRAAGSDDPGSPCPGEACGASAPSCPFAATLTFDATEQVSSAAGRLARASAEAHYASIPEYVRAVLLLNRLREYAATRATLGQLSPARTVGDLVAILRDPPLQMEGYFEEKIRQALTIEDADEAEDPLVLEMLKLPGTALEKYVELICLKRMRQEHGQLVRLVDSLGQKNREGGFIRQNPGVRAPRWFVLDSHLLETLVHVALVDLSPEPRTRPILIRDFLAWLRDRYGIELYAPAYRAVAPEEYAGWRMNQAAFRERLRQIGFFSDLSDAFNSQTLRPRYVVGPR